MKNYFIFAAMLLAALECGFAEQAHTDVYNIPLKGNNEIQNRISTSQRSEFTNEEYKDWTLTYDKYTDRPYLGMGKPVKINGFNNPSNINIKDAALKYLNDNYDFLKINADQLELVRSKKINNKWHVTFYQTYENSKVLFSEVELKINQNAEVFAFRVQYFDFAETAPVKLSYSTAIDKAIKAVDKYHQASDVLLSDDNSDKIYILPLRSASGVKAKKVYKVDYAVKDAPAFITSYVDAENGEILWQYNNIHNFQQKISAVGEVYPQSRFDEKEILPFAYQYITVNNQRYSLDNNGETTIDVDDESSVQISSVLASEYCEIQNEFTSNASYLASFQAGDDIQVNWSDANSHTYERHLFYHFHKVRDWVKSLDENCHGLNQQLPIQLQGENQMFPSANAYFSSYENVIAFVQLGDENYCMPEAPSILYHEYGHAINHYIYSGEGIEEGMINASANEGTADAMAAFVNDNSIIGLGFEKYNDAGNVRDVNNTNKYPNDLEGESHHDGKILGGAFWDLRKATSLETASNLLHFAKYGLPDDPDVGAAFTEWLFEVIVADDDDGDLSNGTPHLNEILSSFDKHGIGLNLLMQLNFEHTPAKEIIKINKTYNMNFAFVQNGLFKIENIKMIYSDDDFETQSELEVPYDTDGQYELSVSQFDKPGIWSYYFEVTESNSTDPVKLTSNRFTKEPFKVLVGYYSIHKDDFEDNTSWEEEDKQNNSDLIPKWEVVIPNEFHDYYGNIFRLGRDNSEVGSYCYSTGNSAEFQFVSPGSFKHRSLISSEYEIAGMQKPVLRFFYWLKKGMTVIPDSEYDLTLSVEYQTDNAGEWKSIGSVANETTEDWEKAMFYIPEDISEFSTIRFKFKGEVSKLSAYMMPVNLMFDDVEVLDAEPISSVPDQEMQATVYPNPATDRVIVADEFMRNFTSFEVLTVLGNTMDKGLLQSNQINVANLTPGVYILRLIGDNEFKTVKFIKN